MNEHRLDVIIDSSVSLMARIDSVRAIGSTGDAASLVYRALDRPRPVSIGDFEGRSGEERVVDLYLVEVLNRLGDRSQNGQVTEIISKADNILEGSENEFLNASIVVKTIGDDRVYQNLFDLLTRTEGFARDNALLTLECLNLKGAPIGGRTDELLPTELREFRFTFLREELATYVAASSGRLVLSDATQAYLVNNDYYRGEVSVEAPISFIVENHLRNLELTYSIDSSTVTVRTMEEAASLWRDWWTQGPEIIHID